MKKTKTWQIVLIIIIASVFYSLPFIGIAAIAYFFDNQTLEYQKDGSIIVDDIKINNDIETYYDETTNTYYISGTLVNGDDDLESVSIYFKLYDKDNNVLGTASAYMDKLDKNENWKFKATYSSLDASEVSTYEIINIEYY